MHAPASRAQDIAARLTAWGFTPRITRHQTHIRIETDVSEPVAPERWRALLVALERGDRFGLNGIDDRHIAWAVIDESPRNGALRRAGAWPPASGS
ncbi:hypothetical protein [Streptomyces sp. NPDC127098]|uniref:hypothetical protein n=1 Tax=Streptomyces sp. NPDC127098 TaxID=3347137 RepID=UPI00365F5669